MIMDTKASINFSIFCLILQLRISEFQQHNHFLQVVAGKLYTFDVACERFIGINPLFVELF
jgi:hypothetical protein